MSMDASIPRQSNYHSPINVSQEVSGMRVEMQRSDTKWDHSIKALKKVKLNDQKEAVRNLDHEQDTDDY